MVLTDKEALEYIRNPYNKQEIADLQKECKELRANVTGKNAKEYLTELPQFERDELRDERLKMMLSNVNVLSSTLKPRNRIFSAKGGVEHFIITDQQKEKEFRAYLDNVTQGLSYKQWIQQFAMRRNDYDPNGIILFEKNSKGKVYPCFKSILDIHDRQLCGRTPEYLILKLCSKEIDKLKKNKQLSANVNNKTDIFRVIDDTTDRLFYKDKLVPNSNIPSFYAPNFPGIVSSNIPSDEDGIFYSPINDAIELLRKLTLHDSLYNVVFARQAFPKEFMQRFPCPNCQGTGSVNSVTCPECHGNKIMLSQKHSDTLIVDWGEEANKNIPNPPMGNVAAAVDTLEFFDDDIEKLKDIIYYVIWGMYKSDKISSIRAGVTREAVGSNIEPTAYQAMLNSQPMVTQLVEFSKWYIDIYRFGVNLMGKTYLGKKYFQGCAILGGDRFMIESPDATWDRYLKAVKAQAPLSELDSILTEYIENKYCNNPILYRKYMLLLGVEPFLHYTIEQVEAFDIPIIQKMEKIYYSSWKNSLTDWDFTTIADGLIGDEEEEYQDGNDVDDETDDEVQATSKEGKINPVKNLKESLRKFVQDKMKDDAGITKPFVTEAGIAIPINSVVLKSEPISPKGKSKAELEK